MPTDNIEALWQTTLEQLQLQMTKATYNTWLRGTRAVALENGTLTVAVRHPYARDWLSQRLHNVVGRTVSRVFDCKLEIAYVLHEQEAAPVPEDDLGDEMLVEAVHERSVTITGRETFTWNNFYIRILLAFRVKALRVLKGAPLSVFLCLALHVDRDGVAKPGLELMMEETGYSRSIVVAALQRLIHLGLVEKRQGRYRSTDEYFIKGYAYFGPNAAPALWEEDE